MTDQEEHEQNLPRIEGGIDAIVIGADAEGLASAAYFGRAGLKTVLLEAQADVGGSIQERNFKTGQTYVDGEHLVSILDPKVISDLDLYRHGISYAARILDTVYFFEDDEPLYFSGDLESAAVQTESEDKEAIQTFITDVMEAARVCLPIFNPQAKGLSEKLAGVPPELINKVNRFASSSIESVLDGYFPESAIKTALTSEAAFSSSAAPGDPFGFMGLVRRWAGETSGLQGAVAYAEGGALTIITALRRAAQAAKVDIRASAPVSSILIEHDRVAGVELAGGGQLRAPIIVAALDAERVFMDLIGAQSVDIEFQRAITVMRPRISTARLYLSLKGVARDAETRKNMGRRLVYAPSPEALRRAFATARRGEIPTDFVLEAIFPDVLDTARDQGDRQLLSAVAHPLPFDENPDDDRRLEIEQSILSVIDRFVPDIEGRIEAIALHLPSNDTDNHENGDDNSISRSVQSSIFAAPPTIAEQIALSRIATSAGDIAGLYFCGPEARIGAGLSCAAGRAAAKRALSEMRGKMRAA